MCYPVNIAKFLRTPILKNICEGLLLNFVLLTNLVTHFMPVVSFSSSRKQKTFGLWSFQGVTRGIKRVKWPRIQLLLCDAFRDLVLFIQF